MSKTLGILIDPKIRDIMDMPYTISFVIRKRMQIDNLNELDKEKRPPEDILWDGSGSDLDRWLDKVLDRKSQDRFKNDSIILMDDMIEG